MAKLTKMQFITGGERDVVIDKVFAVGLPTILKQTLEESTDNIKVEGVMPFPSTVVEDYYFVQVAAGLLLFNKSNKIVGAYLRNGLAVDSEDRTQGLGTELTYQYFKIFKSFPHWDHDKVGMSRAGFACHEHAWEMYIADNKDDEPAVVFTNLSHVSIGEATAFTYQHKVYRRDHRVKTFLEKILDLKIKACFTNDANLHPKKSSNGQKKEMDWGCATIILFMESGKIVEMQNSEWAKFISHR